ncbi:MAG: hypothetical protein JXL81_13635, partial [Deltaproteobacteria bacterium]|nr:hypothetical protein [Deltaproteobacteria bacterium]
GKKSLILGIVIGIVLSFLYFNFFAPRYEINKTAMYTVKVDKWTGQSWRLVDNNWKKMVDIDEDWELIDKTLGEAIKINLPEAQVDSGAALKKLRDRYPVLKEIPDYDLLERIKLVYSKQVLVGMYLSGFMNVEKSSEEASRE